MTVLVLPGWGGSGPAHWQSLWEREYGYRRVEQDDWEAPVRDAWVARLDEAVRASAGQVWLVAHSLACALVAHFAASARGRVAGALLVAPADVECVVRTPEVVRSFAPLPMSELPFRSVVVASADDPYMDLERARELARAWGSRFVDAGRCGHLNADSNLGLWPEGHALLEGLRCEAGDEP